LSLVAESGFEEGQIALIDAPKAKAGGASPYPAGSLFPLFF